MQFISNQLWCELKKLLPKKNNRVGRPEFDNYRTIEGILFILYTGIQWNKLPKEYGNYKTIHGKFMTWCRKGLFKNLMAKARELYEANNSENNWFAVDSIAKKAPFAQFGGKNPTDRGKNGIKETILVDRRGAPLFLHVTSANTHDSKLLEPILNQLPSSENIRIIAADSAFDVKKLYQFCTAKNMALIASINPRRNKKRYVFHAPCRWIVERTFGILSWFRGLKFCWSKYLQTRTALLELACSIRLFRMIGILR